MSTSTPTATIYTRMSLDMTGEGKGVERQEQECREYCERMGWAVAEVYTDNDISATTGKKRPGFEALLASAPERVVVFHTDRLVRLTKELERVIDLGVNVHALHAGHLDLSNPAGKAVAITITAWAQYEGEQKSVRQKAAFRQRAAAGRQWWSTRPFGYEMNGSRREPEASQLAQAYADVLNSVPLGTIAKRWNRDSVLTAKGNAWRAVSVRQLLMNARNAGIKVYGGEEVGPGAWEPVVPEEVYRATVRLLNRAERRTGGDGKRIGLLVGVAKCGVCQGNIHRGKRKPKKGSAREGQEGRPIYACAASRHVTLDSEQVDEIIAEKTILFLTHRDLAGQVQPSSERVDVAALKTEEAVIRSRLAELAEAFGARSVTLAQMITATDALQADLDEVEAALADAGQGDGPLADLPDAKDVAAVWRDEWDADKRRDVIQRLAVAVTLHPRGKGYRGVLPEQVRVLWMTPHGKSI